MTTQSKKIKNYILSIINDSGLKDYGYKPETMNTKEKLQAIHDAYVKEFAYSNNVSRYNNNRSVMFSEWLKGLPSLMNIDFYNAEIISLLMSWGFITEKSRYSTINKHINSFFLYVSMAFFKLLEDKRLVICVSSIV